MNILWEFPYQQDEAKRIFSKTVHFARYQCPSTGEWHMKGVPEVKTVAEAMSWGMSDDTHKVSPALWKKLVPRVHES